MRLSRRRLLEAWWLLPVGGALGFFGWLGQRAYRIRFGKPDPGPPAFSPGARLRLARVDELPEVWDAKEFKYPVALGASQAEVPSILVRTESPQPGGLSVGERHFLALSRVCPHLGCVCDYVRDPEAAALAYNYRPREGQPVLGCACHFSAFDPERAGRSVSGPAIDPLPRLELEAGVDALYAVGIERA